MKRIDWFLTLAVLFASGATAAEPGWLGDLSPELRAKSSQVDAMADAGIPVRAKKAYRARQNRSPASDSEAEE